MASNRVSSFSQCVKTLNLKLVRSLATLLSWTRTCPIAAILLAPSTLAQTFGPPTGEPWVRHEIDSSSRGADGIRVADINGDGLPDLTTGWEQGGRVSAYINPGFKKARNNWPYVIVGSVKSPEDAVFVDLNSDGRLDVVSSTEGREQSLCPHCSPTTGIAKLGIGMEDTTLSRNH